MIRRHLIAFILSFFLLAVLKPVIVFAQTPIGIINDETNGDLIFDDGTSSEFIRFIKSSRTVSLGDGSSNTHLDLTGFLRLTQPVGVTGSCNPGELYFNGTEVRVCGASNQWENIVTASNSPFGIISGTPDVISNSNGDPSTDDFVFGSDKLDWSSGDEERRFFFDKDKAAFRAGFADDNYWDLGSRGDYSAAFGYNTTASGVKSFATGGLAKASGDYSIALGESLDIAGENTVGIGKNLKTTEDYAMIIGRGFDGTEITNNQDNSLMIGFNSDVPTMIVTADPTGGVGTIGNVGIGNAAPNYRLDVTGTAHVDALNINGQYSLPTSNGTTNQFLRGDGTWQTPPSGLTSTGTANYIPKFTNPSAIENSLIYDDGTNIGIGLTSPDATLHLQALGANIKIENLNGTPALNLYHNGAYAAGQSLGDIAFERQNSGGTDIVFSSISGHVSDHSSSSEDGYITFSTIAAGTSSEKMRIENDGKIGIGTTNIKNKLHVFGGASGVTGSTYSGGVLIENSGNAELRMLTPDVRSSAIFFGNATNDIQAGFAYNFSGNGHLQILAGSGGVPRIIIESGGNVGIGNTNPQQKLHVTGNARIESLALAGTNRLVTVTSDGDLNYLTNATTDVTDKYLRADGTWEIPPGTGNGIYGTSDAISGNHTVSINSSDVLDFDITNSGSLRVLDNGTSAFKIDGDGQILIPDRIYHDGDLNTFFGFPNDDQFFMLAGNKLLIHANAVGSQDELKLGNAGYGDDVDIYIGGDFFYDDGLNNIGIGTTVPGQKLQIEGNLRLSSGTNYVEFKQPTGTYGTHSYTLPSTIPAGNKVLQSNSGILSWVDDSDNQTLTISSTGTSHDIIIANGNTVNISEDQTLSLNNNSGDAEVAISGVTGSKVTLKAGTGIGFTFGGSNDLTIDASGAGDDLGDHIATSNIQLNGKWLSGDGGDEGVFVDGNGNVGIGDGTPDYKLDIYEEKNSTGTDSAIAQYTTIKQTNSAVSMGNFSLVKSTGGGTQYGYFADLQNTGTGSKVGYRVFIDENASSHANTLDGYLSNVINSGMGVAYGFRGTVVGSGTGDLYGLELTMSGGGGGQVIGLNVVGEEKNYLSGNVGIGSLAPTQKLDVKGNLALTNASNQTVAFIPNAGMTASHAYTLPDALPTSTKVLQSNASGDLSWVADGDVDAGNEFQNLGHNDVSTGNHEITINSGTNVTFGETQDLAHLLDQGNIGDDGDHIQIDEIRARDGDGLALEDDGGNGIFIQDGGNVGIGVASPNTKLNVDGGTGLSDLLSDKGFFLIGDVTDRNMVFDDNEIQGRNNGLAEPLLLQKNGGNVGIGTSSTSSRLHIKGSNGDFPVVTYENNTGDYQNFVRLIPPVSGIGATGDIANDVFNGKLYYRKTTGWEEIAVGTSDNLYNADGALPGSTRQVSFGSGAKLNFDANTFLIDGDANNVGVGTDAPISQLHIFANSNGGGISPTSGSLLTLENSSSAYMSIFTADNAESGIVFGNTSLDVDGAIVYKDNATATAEQMELRVNNNATVMTLEGTGNVGIGSADPGYKLDVDGTINADVISIAGVYTLPTDPGSGGNFLTTDGTNLSWANPPGADGDGIYSDDGSLPASTTRNVTFDGGANLNFDANTLFIDGDNDRVGIGTNSPDADLVISSETDGDARLIIRSNTDNSNQNDNPDLMFEQANNGVNAFVGLEGAGGTRSSLTLANAFILGSEDGTASLQLITNDITRFTIRSNGKIGIGTNDPQEDFDLEGQLHIAPQASFSGTADEGDIYVNDTDDDLYFHNGTSWLSMTKPSGNAGGHLTGTYPNPSIANNVVTGAMIIDGTITSTDLGTNSVTSNELTNGSVGTSEIQGSAVTNDKLASGAGGIYKGGGSIPSGTTSVLMGATDVLKFDGGDNTLVISNDQIGIGESNPNTKLDIKASDPSKALVKITNEASNGYSGITFHNNSGTWKGGMGYANTGAGNNAGKMYINALDGTDLNFYTQPTSGSGSVKMMIDNGGDVTVNGGDVTVTSLSGAGNRMVIADASGGLSTQAIPTATSEWSDDGSGNIYNTDLGNVGVGTSTPDKLMDVADASGPSLLLKRSDANTAANELLGQILFDNTDGGISSSDAGAVIAAYADQDQSVNDKGSRIVFKTKAHNTISSAPAVERLRIDHDGQVGIGVTNPQNDLDINGGIDFNDYIRHRNNTTTQLGFPDNNQISFNTDGVERLRIDENGNVGIGSNNPGDFLILSDAAGAGLTNPLTLRLHNTTSQGSSQILFDEGALGTSEGIMGIRYHSNSGGSANAIEIIDNSTTPEAKFRVERNLNETVIKGHLNITSGDVESGSDDVRIHSNGDSYFNGGNLGLGVTDPDEMLEVDGAIALGDVTAPGATAGLGKIYQNSGDLYYLDPSGSTVNLSSGSSSFWTAAGNDIYNNNSGNVGVGTASPSTKLEVYGAFQSADGPHLNFSMPIGGTDRTIAQFSMHNNDDISMVYGGHYDYSVTNWRSADAGSNFMIRKVGDKFKFNYLSGKAIGSTFPTGDWGDGIVLTNDGKVGIGTDNPDNSAILHLESTSKGFMMPRMTYAQMNAISSPGVGLQVYATDEAPGVYTYNQIAPTPPTFAWQGETTIVKLNSESVTNSDTPQPDDELFFMVRPGEIWRFEGYLYVTCSNASRDFRLQAVNGAGQGLRIRMIGTEQEGLDGDANVHGIKDNVTFMTFDVDLNNGATELALYVEGILNHYTGTANDIFELHWSQNSAGGQSTTVNENSFIKFERIR